METETIVDLPPGNEEGVAYAFASFCRARGYRGANVRTRPVVALPGSVDVATAQRLWDEWCSEQAMLR